MIQVRSRPDLEEALDTLKAERGIGFVPTMGALHGGHQALIARGKEDGPVVVSIFVNPKQFGAGEDLARYPKDPEGDAATAAEAGCDVLYTPDADEVYPPHFRTEVRVAGLEGLHCGRFRPGHFTGVTTVLARLFGLVRPRRAYFGQKDYQQGVIVRRMVQDLALSLDVVMVPTVREADGLAMSSRNRYLSARERQAAPDIHARLVEAKELFRQGETDPARLLGRTSAALSRIPGFRIQYLNLADPVSLAEVRQARPGDVLLTAGFFGTTRLIDNEILG